jgi:glucokinase
VTEIEFPDLNRRDNQPGTSGCGIAVDMGASYLRFVLAGADGQILHEDRERVNSESGPKAVISQIRDGIGRLVERETECGALRGIAIGVPGAVDPRSGKVLDANNVPGWREVDMGRELEQAFEVPVFLDNDANMAAIGEHWRGIAKDIDNFVFVALGTGIGSGLFVDGRICRGRSGFAGELFRMNLEWDRWDEEFPDTGYLEAHVAGVGLAIAGRKVLTGGNGGQSSTLAESRDARYVFEALRQGNPQARALVEKALVMLGVGVANMVSILDPEMIVFNGGIVQGAPELLLETVTRVVGRIHPKAPSVQLSSLGDKAQIWGALHTLLEPQLHRAIRAGQTRGK